MPFIFEKTPISGLLVIHPEVFKDERGFFLESYKNSEFVSAGIPDVFAQDNHSMSTRGVLRGLHFQVSPMEQGKLVRVVSGSIWDVAVDLRPASSTKHKWFGLELSAENKTMFYIPPGFAHGFLSLADDTLVYYKCTGTYSKENERAIAWNDPEIGIKWPLDKVGGQPILSDKDKVHPRLKEAEINHVYS